MNILGRPALHWIKSLYDIIAYIISPPLCYSCRGHCPFRVILCDRCEQSLEEIAPKMFILTNSYILTVYAVSRYTEPLRPMLFAKYRSDPAVIEKLAELMWKKSVVSLVKIDCFIPIPLHWSRSMQRGFNQSELIARSLSHYSNVPVIHALKRIKKTQSQVRVEQVDRRCNVKGAFELTEFDFDIAGKHIMLVDDSCTTGSTAIEAAKVFIKLKPASINMVVACRAL
ncbi:MAG TPA: ComF family protein [Candidatus Saccharimonadales bacterium]|nr:ComF family protein [Candidatus Saccharimonadales bacterium]